MKKLHEAYDNLLNAKIEGEGLIDEDSKVYYNFMEIMFDKLKYEYYFDHDIFEEVIGYHFRDINEFEALDNKSKYLEELTNELIENFNSNTRSHFLIVPMQKSSLEEDIVFDDFLLLKKRPSESEYVTDISDLLNLSKDKVKQMINHTHNSRSKDFLNDNIIIFKIKDHTSYIKTYATSIMTEIFSFIRIIYFYTESSTSFFQSHLAYWNNENKHVLILSDEDWRNGHGYRGETPNFVLNYDLNFLKDKDNQKLLNKFVDTFSLNKRKDALIRLFHNAIQLFDSAIKFENQDIDIYNILMMTTAETLITQGENEKRLRISAIIPRIVDHSNLNNFQIAKIISAFYLRRNSFVHGGESQSNTDSDDYKILTQIISKLIVFYFIFSEDLVQDNNIKRINQWNNYVNGIFENIIYGSENDSSTKN